MHRLRPQKVTGDHHAALGVLRVKWGGAVDTVEGMLLIAYDGSDDAKAAIAAAAKIAPGGKATVLTTWEPIIEALARSGAGFGQLVVEPAPEIDVQLADAAGRAAEEGVALANAAGLQAEPLAESSMGRTAHTINVIAERIGADAIVLGNRGLGRVKSAMLGSVSAAVLHHATRPVMIVPHARAH